MKTSKGIIIGIVLVCLTGLLNIPVSAENYYPTSTESAINPDSLLSPPDSPATVGDLYGYFNTGDCSGDMTGLQITGIFHGGTAESNRVAGISFVHGWRRQHSDGGTMYNVDICSMTLWQGPEWHMSGANTAVITSNYTYTTSDGKNSYKLYEWVKLYHNGSTVKVTWGLALYWYNNGGGSMHYAEVFWKINWAIPDQSYDNGDWNDGTTWYQVMYERVISHGTTDSYYPVRYYYTNQNSGVDYDSISTTGYTNPTTKSYAIISGWEDLHHLSPNADGDASYNTDIWGAFGFEHHNAWTSGMTAGAENTYAIKY